MIIECKRPVLILEGLGDKAALPRLIRELYRAHNIFDINPTPKPKLNVEVKKLYRTGELERFIQYASDDEGDSVLVILDCDELCPVEIVKEFSNRILKMNLPKKVGISLFKSEFETIFIHCLLEIAEYFPDYKWNLGEIENVHDVENIRGAKEFISSKMSKERAYKPTRDQEKFITAINFNKLRIQSRSFRHFESTLLWLAGKSRDMGSTYPAIL